MFLGINLFSGFHIELASKAEQGCNNPWFIYIEFYKVYIIYLRLIGLVTIACTALLEKGVHGKCSLL